MLFDVRTEFPRPERERERWLCLNGAWDFMLFRDRRVADVDLTRDAPDFAGQINVPFSWGCKLSNVCIDAGGAGLYARRVSFEKSQRVFICFNAVDYDSKVYINGAFAGAHTGGYTYFELDITDMWREGGNTVEVWAEDLRKPFQACGKQRYGQVQGIWQPVWLEARPNAYIDDFRIDARANGDVVLDISAKYAEGETIEANFAGISAKGNVENGRCLIGLSVCDPVPWSPESPFLYEGTISLGDDRVKTYFGLRDIEARGGKILLNGKPLFISGALDQGYNPDGFFTYPDERSIKDEVWRVKRLGLNCARLHIKPEEPRKLYHMDRMGVLAIEDMPCFWCPPDAESLGAYESEVFQTIARDYNHPCVISWVLFNETWGLLSDSDGGKVFLPETQSYLEGFFGRAKAFDRTRLIEDNSPCLYDHVVTDVNSWHFYYWGYEKVREHIDEVCRNTYSGSVYNYAGGRTQNGAPLLNSECGMVWGVDGSAGDSDISWQYKYMLNEFRMREKINGFVFTELRDVVNEFNGYYRIDLRDKYFGYDYFCRGMTLRDMHAVDFLAVDFPPCTTCSAGGRVNVPLKLSCPMGGDFGIAWEMWHDSLDGRVCDCSGSVPNKKYAPGVNALAPVSAVMPSENALAVLSLYLTDGSGATVHRNFTVFDVRAETPSNCVDIQPSDANISGFAPVWRAMGGEKLCLGGAGEVEYFIPVMLNPAEIDIFIEAGAKRVLSKDLGILKAEANADDARRGYRTDRGGYESSYIMTDEDVFVSHLTALIDGETVMKRELRGDRADSRGALSWHAQSNPNKLDEAGSYGEEIKINVPSRMLSEIFENGGFTLTLRTDSGGLALYGRNCGSRPHGILARITPMDGVDM